MLAYERSVLRTVELTVLQHLLDALLELSLVGNTGAVDIVDTRSNVAGVSLVDEHLEQLGVGLGVLNGENISIQRGDGVEEVLELRVAEVAVDLGRVLDASGGQLEAVDGPAEVSLSLRSLAERETLLITGQYTIISRYGEAAGVSYTQGRLVDLDDEDAVLLKVDDLVTEGQSELLALNRLVDVVTRERPPEAGDGSSKHALHGLLGDRRSVLGLLDGHGSRARDVADNDGRPHAARAVRLNPV